MVVRAENITKNFIRKRIDTNIFTAVMDVSIEIPAGELTVIMGRSGSGKSTLVNMLSGILSPTSGKVYYDSTDIYSLDDEELSEFRNTHIGFVPQGKSAIASLTVIENILLPQSLYGTKDEERAMELMEQFNIGSLKDVMPQEMSGGELRRMSIARALINNPKVIFADEPTGDLDNENTKIVFNAFREIANGGTTVVMVTHENAAKEIADRIFTMDAGALNGQGC